jgi:hypothetical protein
MTSKIKVDNINKVSDDTNIIKKCGTTITLGASGDSIALASGASQTGFGREGSVDWQTGSIKTAASFTAANGEGYFVDTSSNAITANLPAGSAGAIVAFSDYARNFATNALTVTPNGSEKIGGIAASALLSVNGQAATFVYIDSTKGWINVQNAEDTEAGNAFITATGGTITTCGNDKIHTFTGPGTFTVNQVHPCAANNLVSYVVVGGGGAGGTDSAATSGGGGGAGGYRETKSPVTPYTASPLCGHGTPGNRITVTATAFPITVGAGATALPGPSPSGPSNSPGSNSIFSTITSAGGGGGASNRGGSPSPSRVAGCGGSGGGSSYYATGNTGSGNTPSVTPPQGNGGGAAKSAPAGPAYGSGGGGGASATGSAGSTSKGGDGGAGVASEITGSNIARSGGGGGASWEDGPPSSQGAGGNGGGGAGGADTGNAGVAGTVNTGGGGGGASGASGEVNLGGNGGSGIVIIRYKTQ